VEGAIAEALCQQAVYAVEVEIVGREGAEDHAGSHVRYIRHGLWVKMVKEVRVARTGQPYLMTPSQVKSICAWRSGNFWNMCKWFRELCLDMGK
jgi:hypothetical protein